MILHGLGIIQMDDASTKNKTTRGSVDKTGITNANMKLLHDFYKDDYVMWKKHKKR
jgi:hypothetical protein